MTKLPSRMEKKCLMRTEKQKIIKQVHICFFLIGSCIFLLQRCHTFLFEKHLSVFHVGSGGAPHSSASLAGLENSLFLAMYLPLNIEIHELTCLVLLCTVGSKVLDFSAIFCKKRKKKRLRKQCPNI